LRVDDDGVALVGLHLQQVARHEVGRGFLSVGFQAGHGLGAQIGHLVGGASLIGAESADRLPRGRAAGRP
jgi:hypothetical protein